MTVFYIYLGLLTEHCYTIAKISRKFYKINMNLRLKRFESY